MPSNDFIHLEIDDEDLNALLRELRARGEDFSPVTAEIANTLYDATDETFDNERAFDGTPWERLADTTIEAKGHDSILYDEGEMRDSLGFESDGGKAKVGLNAYSNGYPYPALHQFGSDKTPARPFLPFDENKALYDEAKEEIIEIVRAFLEEV